VDGSVVRVTPKDACEQLPENDTTRDLVADGAEMGAAVLGGRLFDAVLFDMDGTLVDSTASVYRSWMHWAGEFGVPAERLAGWHGVPAKAIVEAVLDAPRREAALARIEELEVLDADGGIVVLDGVHEALAALPAGRAAIVTSCTAPLARARIAATGLAAPSVVVTASEVVVGKPDPEPYLLGARRLGVDPARCLVVEDAPAGLASGRAAGAATLAVVTTHTAGELDADLVVGGLADVRFVAGPDGVSVHRATG
jgi:mannitol-1-/sugar-/sorbitol-6-phosphatase